MKKKVLSPLLVVVFLLSTLFAPSFSQEVPIFLSLSDSCHIAAPKLTDAHRARRASSISSPLVRIAYIIPSNRTEQPDGVEILQQAIKAGQEWFEKQMEQNGFGAKTYLFETEPGTTTPLIHVVHISQTDDYLRADIWNNTIRAASQAGVSVWTRGEVWVLVPEAHLMMSDGSVIGGVALGASHGTGDSPGVAMIGSDILPFFHPALETPHGTYDGKILPTLGPYPMKQNKTAPWFEGTTFSSTASSRFGALFHEMGHAFGLGHDYRNDTNFHGNLMFNGLRGIRGSLFPELFPRDHTRLAYASALVLNESHYFNRNKKVTSPPVVSFPNDGSVTPEQGHVRIKFQATDNDQLSFALLRLEGNTVAEMALKGSRADASFVVPYYTKGANNRYTVAVYDKQGNTRNYTKVLHVPDGHNQAPTPYVRIEPPAPKQDQSVSLQGSRSRDADHAAAFLKTEWDIDNDGQYDIGPVSINPIQYLYERPGNYLIRLRVTDPAGAQTVSTPVSIKIPGELQAKVESLTLIDTERDEEIADLQDGDVIDLTMGKYQSFGIRANTSPKKVDRVKFKLSGPTRHTQVEKKHPYALFGDKQGDYHQGNWLPGRYTLKVTPFLEDKKGTTLTVSFEVTGMAATRQITLVDTTLNQLLRGSAKEDIIDRFSAPPQVVAYPVPTSGVVNVRYRGEPDRLTLMLLDFSGNLLLKRPFSGSAVEQLDLSMLKKGIYYLRIISPETVFIKRVVVE